MEQAIERIKRHIDQFKNFPDNVLAEQIQKDEHFLIGRQDPEYILLRKEIHLIVDEYERSIKAINTEQALFKNVMDHIKKYGSVNTMPKTGFNIIKLYETYIVYNYNENDFTEEFGGNQGRQAYVKAFNQETGEFIVTDDKNEAACFFNNDTINAFHRILTKQYKFEKYGNINIFERYDKYGNKVFMTVPYKKVSGGWQVSELIHYDIYGHITDSLWYYPNNRYPEGFIPYK